MPALALALLGASGSLQTVSSSTEAWLLAHVLRVGWLGDSHLAAAVGLTPNLAYDPLYPWLLIPFAPSGPGEDPTSLLFAAHALSALGWGLAALALGSLWREATGRRSGGIAGAAALLLPPVIGTAALARADSLAIGLALAATWASLVACRKPSGLRFGLAGLLVGLCFLAREYLAIPALAALLMALWISLAALPRWKRARVDSWLPGLLGALAGLSLGAAGLPLALGLSPLAGIEALLHYGAAGRAVNELRAGPLLLCVVGIPGYWLAWRSGTGDRRALLLLGATFLPSIAFFASAQQSPQYYLLGAGLLLSGVGGLVAALPGRLGPTVGAMGLVVLGMGLDSAAFRAAADQPGPRVLGFHSESWPCPVDQVEAAVAQANAWSEGGPLLLVSGGIENIDGLAWLRLSRPVAFAYPFELDKLDRLAPEYNGRPIAVVAIELYGHEPALPVPEVARWEGACLEARMGWLPGEPLDHPGGCGPEQPRGACLQAWWLSGGIAQMREKATAFQARWRPGLLGFSP